MELIKEINGLVNRERFKLTKISNNENKLSRIL